MYDPDAPSTARVAAELKDAKARTRLFRIGLQITGSRADADDLVGDALERVIDPDAGSWGKWKFLTHLTYTMRHLWDQQRRAVRFEREQPDEDVTRGKRGLSQEPRADDELDRRRTLALRRQLGAQLVEELGAKHPLAVQCFRLAAQGTEERAEQARILKRTIEDVNAAHELLRYHGGRIREQWEVSEAIRMKELRTTSRRFRPEVES